MKKLFFCISLFIFSFSFSYGQSWDWGRDATGSLKSNDYGSPVAIDEAGNAYITGQYDVSANFGKVLLTNNTGDIVYLAKYDPAGNVIWAVQPIDTIVIGTNSYGTSVTVDHAGHIYITGFFGGELIFGNDTLVGDSNNGPVFLAKYNSSGKAIWAKEGIGKDIIYSTAQSLSVTNDQLDNVIITGTFQDTISFGAYTLTTQDNSSSVFVVKYDSGGNVIWARQAIVPAGVTSSGNSVVTDNQNNIYVTGDFDDSILFSPYALAGSGSFITKYSPSGNVLWAKQNENFAICSSKSITRDGKPNIYIAGYFSDSLKFGTYGLYSPIDNSAFLAKYDVNGNVIWAKQSSAGMEALSMSQDGADHIYMAGVTISHSNYSFGNYTFQAVPKSDTDNGFLLKFDTAGTAVCGSLVENLWYMYQSVGVASLYLNASTSYIYMGGTFGAHDTVLCGPDTLPANNATIFLGRWNECPIDAGVNEVKAESAEVKVYPNPSNGNFTFVIASETKQSQPRVEVYNILGEKVFNATLKQVQGDNTINLSNQANGIYLYRVISETCNLVGEGKIIVQK